MWTHVEGSDATLPPEQDTTSSNCWVYIRHNFVLVPASEERPEHYEWDETKIPKQSWDVVKEVLDIAERAQAQADFTAIMTDTEIG